MISLRLRIDAPRIEDHLIPSIEWALMEDLLDGEEASNLLTEEILTSIKVEVVDDGEI